jgi:hypothetical protein
VPTAIHAASLEAGPRVLGEDEYARLQAGMDDTEELPRAVACVRHLLGPEARGLTGKTVSAVHDDWRTIGPLNVDGLNDSPVWTRSRLPAAKSLVTV